MKRLLIIFLASSLAIVAKGQENAVTLNGSYVFTNIEDFDASGTGWRISGLYEFTPTASKFTNGVSFGYISTNAVLEVSGAETQLDAGHWPFYYQPKYTFGDGAVQIFVKAALGWHWSSYERTGTLGGQLTSGDGGFYGGLGAGLTGNLGEKFFINLDYEWAYLDNSWYKDGFVNSISLGAGIRF